MRNHCAAPAAGLGLQSPGTALALTRALASAMALALALVGPLAAAADNGSEHQGSSASETHGAADHAAGEHPADDLGDKMLDEMGVEHYDAHHGLHALPDEKGEAHGHAAAHDDHGHKTQGDHGHGAGAHKAGGHGDHGHGDHGHGGAHEEHEHEHAAHAIASVFDFLKVNYKDSYKAKSKYDEAYWKVWKAQSELEAIRGERVDDLKGEDARDKRIAAKIIEIEELQEKERHYGQLWSHAPVDAKIGVYLYQNKYGGVAAVVVILWVLIGAAICRSAAVIPGRAGSLGEMLVGGLMSLFEPVLGTAEARRYFPFLATLFCFILFNNLMSITPGMLAPSANFFSNIGLGLAVFCYVQYIGLTRTGPKKYILHFMGDPPANPKTFIEYGQWGMGVVLMLPLEILGELIRPISLSLRLFGNILGEDILLFVFLGIGVMIPAAMFAWFPVGLPLHILVYPLILLGCTIQALVFTLLSAVYISLKLPHGDHGDHGHGDHGHGDHGHGHGDHGHDHAAHSHAAH
jgi:F-type H+-transporting ATPase subunit a